MLRIAIQTKGRLNEQSIALMREIGIDVDGAKRKFLSKATNFPIEVLYLRDDDIPQVVANGTATLGIVGMNEVAERGCDVDIVAKLGFGGCRISLAIPKSEEYEGVEYFNGKRIATSYPNILRQFLEECGVKAQLEVISGSVEIAPAAGIADAIFDIVSSGGTLVSNGLKEVERVFESEAVLIANKNLSAEDKALLEELRPWLVEFAKLGTRCRKALEAMELFRAGDYEAFWAAYVDNLMTEAEIEQYDAHRSGTMKLKPFYERLMDGMAAAYYEALTGEKSSVLTACGTYRSLGAPQAKYMFDNDLETYYHSGEGQRTDDFVGVDLGVVRKVREVRIIQGRNSVDDVDYFDHCVLEYSVDGQEWFAMTEPMEGVYDIEWQGEAVEARYVGIRKLESKKRNWLAVRSFEINPVSESEYGWDANPFTKVDNRDGVTVEVPRGMRSVQLLLGELSSDAYVRVYDAANKAIADIELVSSNTTLDLTSQVHYIYINNQGGLYEVVFK